MTITHFAERCRQPSITTGTGPLSLMAPPTGFQALSAGFNVSEDLPYAIEGVDSDGDYTGEWEVGRGHLNILGQLVREVVYDSSDGGDLVNFTSASLNVFVTTSDGGLTEWLLNNLPPVTPAGNDGEIQFNDDGVLSASSSLTWNGTQLFVNGNIKGAGYIELPEMSAPTQPPNGFGRLYVKSDNKIYFKGDDDVEHDLTSLGVGGIGSGETDRITFWANTTDITSSAQFVVDHVAPGINVYWEDANDPLAFGAWLNAGNIHSFIDDTIADTYAQVLSGYWNGVVYSVSAELAAWNPVALGSVAGVNNAGSAQVYLRGAASAINAIHSDTATALAITHNLIEAVRFNASGQSVFRSGSAATPSITFVNETGANSGIYGAGNDNIGWAIAGAAAMDLNATRLNFASTIVVNAGTGAASGPSYSFTGNTNAGIYSGGAASGTMLLATGGSQRWQFLTTSSKTSLPILGAAGSASAPQYAFDVGVGANTGMYYSNTGPTLFLASGGVERAAFSDTEAVFNEGGLTYNFRVESDTLTHLLFVDATNNKLIIGGSTNNASTQLFDIQTTSTSINSHTARIKNTAASGNSAPTVRWESDNSSALTLGILNSTYATSGQLMANRALISTTGANGMLFNAGSDTFVFHVGSTGTATGETLRMTSTEVVFNDAGADRDLRIEGDTNANLFFVDASVDRIGVGTNAPGTDSMIHIQFSNSSGTGLHQGVLVENQHSGGIAALQVTNQNHAVGASWRTYGTTSAQTFLGTTAAGNASLQAYGASLTALKFGTDVNVPVIFGTFATTASSGVEFMRLVPGSAGTAGFVFNENARGDIDFRIESQNRTHVFFVDTDVGNSSHLGRVGINRSSLSSTFSVDNGASTESIFIAYDNGAAVLTVADAGDVSIVPISGHTQDSLLITSGALASQKSALKMTGTLSSSVASQIGVDISLIGAGSGFNLNIGMQLLLNNGFTGSDSSFGQYVGNLSTGVATGAFLSNSVVSGGSGGGNIAVASHSQGFTAGDVLGLHARATGSTSMNMAISAQANDNVNGPARQIGLFASARHGSVANVGVWSTLYNTGEQSSALAALTSAAILADNANLTSPIFIGKDNGSTVYTLADFGYVTSAPTAATTGSPTLFTLTGPAHTGLTASTEAVDVNFALTRIVQFTAGDIATQRAFVIAGPVYAFTGSSTITSAITLNVTPPSEGSGATFTNRYAIFASGLVHTRGLVMAGQPMDSNLPAISIQMNSWSSLTASTERPLIDSGSAVKTWAAGAISVQREILFQSPSYAFASASTITDAATVAITDAPTASTNATITNRWAFWVQAGRSKFGGAIDVLGNAGFAIETISSNDTLNDTHHTVLVDSTGGTVTITLPPPDGITRRRYEILKKVAANTVIIDADTGTINGESQVTLTDVYQSITVVCDGTEWFIV